MEQKILIFKFLFLFFIINFSILAQEIVEGNVKVIDGDTIHIGKNKIRLHGIDAPERNQKCFTSNNEWDCGKESTNSLIGLINSRKVSCIILDQDRYKRDIGECYINNLNINKWMVQNGWALAYRYYSKKYVEVENLAKENNSGLWVGEFENPWDFRKKN
ncbi:MAG: hypothetical protein CFH22_01030 [Alphaproteobacteria bacterium MarineAlpha5_Bin12]|nr:nuclease [Pelagibacteraceae bacterium]PPR41108.1 MAG: hypothetical protein CFH22_01030 [Alphaproteobacteria bacterium MarineAlpha5_Bin12]|tara:strand:+ start:21974 stop:22453 length:480 start_codon:yes stop_codon:yes gene_type:complete